MEHKAIFLDRDGVINRERGTHTWRMADFEILPGLPAALRQLQDTGWKLVVITNQSGIALGMYTAADVERLHGYLHAMLAESGVKLTDILYCPHHPEVGRCLCRKPGSLLLEKACARHGIDPARSVMVGDRDRDVQAARAIGMAGVLVASNTPLIDVVNANGWCA